MVCVCYTYTNRENYFSDEDLCENPALEEIIVHLFAYKPKNGL